MELYNDRLLFLQGLYERSLVFSKLLSFLLKPLHLLFLNPQNPLNLNHIRLKLLKLLGSLLQHPLIRILQLHSKISQSLTFFYSSSPYTNPQNQHSNSNSDTKDGLMAYTLMMIWMMPVLLLLMGWMFGLCLHCSCIFYVSLASFGVVFR